MDPNTQKPSESSRTPEIPVKEPSGQQIASAASNIPVLPNTPKVEIETSHQEENELDKKIYKAEGIGKIAAIVLATIASVFVFFNFVLGITVVDGVSMRPTLKTGDILLVWKLPKTIAAVTNSQYLPARSHVVIVTEPNNPKKQYVKRVIAVPGERVDATDGKILVFNIQYPQGFNPDSQPYGKNLPATSGDFQVSVGSGQVFVMGDNRKSGGSIDSRSSIGAIPANNVVGEVIMRIYPFSKFRTL